MKFKQYYESLVNFVEEHPEVMGYDVVYSSDDEGNEYKRVVFSPSIGYMSDGDFQTSEEDVWDIDKADKVVCIN